MATPSITLSASQQSNLWKPFRAICSLGLSYDKQILKDRSHKAFLFDIICVISVCSLIENENFSRELNIKQHHFFSNAFNSLLTCPQVIEKTTSKFIENSVIF